MVFIMDYQVSQQDLDQNNVLYPDGWRNVEGMIRYMLDNGLDYDETDAVVGGVIDIMLEFSAVRGKGMDFQTVLRGKAREAVEILGKLVPSTGPSVKDFKFKMEVDGVSISESIELHKALPTDQDRLNELIREMDEYIANEAAYSFPADDYDELFARWTEIKGRAITPEITYSSRGIALPPEHPMCPSESAYIGKTERGPESKPIKLERHEWPTPGMSIEGGGYGAIGPETASRVKDFVDAMKGAGRALGTLGSAFVEGTRAARAYDRSLTRVAKLMKDEGDDLNRVECPLHPGTHGRIVVASDKDIFTKQYTVMVGLQHEGGPLCVLATGKVEAPIDSEDAFNQVHAIVADLTRPGMLPTRYAEMFWAAILTACGTDHDIVITAYVPRHERHVTPADKSTL